MTYSLSNNCTKNYYNRPLAVQIIVEDVVTWIFFETQCSNMCMYCTLDIVQLESYCALMFDLKWTVLTNMYVLLCRLAADHLVSF